MRNAPACPDPYGSLGATHSEACDAGSDGASRNASRKPHRSRRGRRQPSICRSQPARLVARIVDMDRYLGIRSARENPGPDVDVSIRFWSPGRPVAISVAPLDVLAGAGLRSGSYGHPTLSSGVIVTPIAQP
jgi:hypothetical protein